VTLSVDFMRPAAGARKNDPPEVRRESAHAFWLLQPAQPPAPAAEPGPRPCQLDLTPTAVVLRDGGASALLSVAAHHRPSDRPPRLRLRQKPDGVADLLRALEQLEGTTFRGPLPGDGPGVEKWSAELSLALPAAARDQLKGLAAYEPLSLACQVVVDGAAEADFLLRVAPHETAYPGLVAMDLGTSSSTVTLFDPYRIPDVGGVPPEQEGRLKALLLERLLDDKGKCRMPGVADKDWAELLDALDVEALDPRGDAATPRPARLRAAIHRGGPDLLEALRQLERHVSGLDLEGPLRDLLQLAYEEALLEPRLNSQLLIWAGLDPARPAERDVVSELEVCEVDGALLRVEMGREARERRIAALARLGAGAASSTLADVRFKYHNSPKRYLGKRQSFVGTLGGRQVSVSAHQVVQAAWQRLTELANLWRQRHVGHVSQGPFTRVVVTYPTVAPPAVRREIEELVRELGYNQVVTDYDEAVSAALFYFHRELGGSTDLGPELFKACAQTDGQGKWFQNVLVLDIGGGSTDLALLRLTMQEETQPDHADRGAGGRYYVVTPRLLGSSGNTYLGGDLITLRVFELLKAALADRVLSAAQAGELAAEQAGGRAVDDLAARARSLADAFKGPDDKMRFRPGSIFTPVATLRERADERRAALDAAEQVLPTRWNVRTQRSSAFFALWDLAEHAKVKFLSQGEPFRLGPDDLQKLLKELGHPLQLTPGVSVELTPTQFEQAAEEIVREAVQIARGLLLDRLPRAGKDGPPEALDWLILSGKTCNLKLVRRVLLRELEQRPAVRWAPDRVTFVPEYAKLATSAGACYAEKIRRLTPDPRQAQELLRLGQNQLRFVINNLFWFLPCSFSLLTASDELELFRAGDELYQLDGSAQGKARSRPLGVVLLPTVLRRDYAGAKPLPWHSFGGAELAAEVGMSPAAFTERMLMQFEVDNRLLMKLYLWEGQNGEPPQHYELDTATPALRLPPPPGAAAAPAAAWCDVAVGAEVALHANGSPKVLIRAGDPFRATFHAGGQEVRGLVVGRLPDLFRDGRLGVYRRLPGEGEWQRLEGELTQPKNDSGNDFPAWYQLTLDAGGALRAHVGRVPYWRTTDPREWRERTDRVLECELGLVVAPPPPARDPFDGSH
jgi:hypothetical protein